MNLNKLKININQVNTITGDLKGNTQRIIDQIQQNASLEIDLTIFPETAISGYLCGSLWDRLDFVKEQRECLNRIHEAHDQYDKHSVLILGFVDFCGVKRNGFPKLYNSVAVIDAYCLGIYHKQILADADHHEDKKYFISGKETKVFNVSTRHGDFTLGVPVCEDAWYTDHHRDIPNEMVEMGAELLVCINQSYFYYGKTEKRHKLYSSIAKNNNVHILNVNSCAVGDILKNIIIFDGGSSVYNNNGELLLTLPQFQEQSVVFRTEDLGVRPFIAPSKYEEICNALIFEQREFFRQCGIKKAQVHVSGGLDSAIVAALVVKAMGEDNTILISNPSSLNTKSKDYVTFISEALGVEMRWNPVQEIFETMSKVFKESFGEEPSLAAQSCMQSTLRTVQGLSASHLYGSGIVSTGNHTEIVLGWSSFHDIGSIGVHSLIGDLTKMELFYLAQHINELYGSVVIHPDLFVNYIGTCKGEFKPAAELPDANEDPIDYKVQSGICASLIRERKSKKNLLSDFDNKMLNPDYFYISRVDENYAYKLGREQFEKEIDFAISKMRTSVYKAAQSAPIVIISPRSRGFSNRETLLNNYK